MVRRRLATGPQRIPRKLGGWAPVLGRYLADVAESTVFSRVLRRDRVASFYGGSESEFAYGGVWGAIHAVPPTGGAAQLNASPGRQRPGHSRILAKNRGPLRDVVRGVGFQLRASGDHDGCP